MVITYNNWCKPQDHDCHFFCNHSSHIMLLDCFLRWMARNVGVSLTYFSNESDKMFFPSPIIWVKVTGNSFPSWHIFVVAKLQVTGHFPLAYILSVGDIFPLAYLSEGYSKNTFVSPDLFFWVKMIWNPFSNNLLFVISFSLFNECVKNHLFYEWRWQEILVSFGLLLEWRWHETPFPLAYLLSE